MPKYNHTFDFCFTVISHSEDGTDIAAGMLLAACRARLATIEQANDGAEMLEACGRFDTCEVEGPDHVD